MATDSAGRALDLLRGLNEELRREKIERLVETQILELNGFTLYKYHLLPQLCKENRGSHSLPVHYAQVRVGLRWSYFTKEEEDYWAAQTMRLREGSILPLEPATYQRFVSGLYYEIPVPVPPAAATPATPIRTAATPHDGRVLFEEHAEATLACLNSTAAEGTDASQLWALLPGTEQDFWCKVATALSKDGEDLSAGAASEQLRSCSVPLGELRRRQTPEKEIKKESHDMHQGRLSWKGASPKSLFHSCWAPQNRPAIGCNTHDQLPAPPVQLAYQSRPQSPLKRKALSAQAPRRSPTSQTNNNNEENASSTMIVKYEDAGPPKKKLRYDPKTLQSFSMPSIPRHIHRNSLAEVSLPELQASARYPIIHLLTGGRAACLHYAPMVNTILASIKSIIECYPEMKLDGRHSGVRITYRPDVTDVTGVAAKLYTMINDCLRTYLSSQVGLHMEHVLRPLVLWNLSMPIWRGVLSSLKFAELWTTFEGSYASCLTFLRAAPFPITYENRQKVVTLIAKEVVHRAKAVGASRRCYDVVRGYELWSSLSFCFNTSGLHPGTCEERVEQKLFLLQRDFPELKLTEQM